MACVEIDMEAGAFSFLAFHLNLATGIVNDLFDNIKSNTRSFYMVVQAFEHAKHFFFMVGRNPQTIVFH